MNGNDRSNDLFNVPEDSLIHAPRSWDRASPSLWFSSKYIYAYTCRDEMVTLGSNLPNVSARSSIRTNVQSFWRSCEHWKWMPKDSTVQARMAARDRELCESEIRQPFALELFVQLCALVLEELLYVFIMLISLNTSMWPNEDWFCKSIRSHASPLRK